MPERAPLRGRGVHSAYVYVGAGLFVGAIPGLLASGGRADPGDLGPTATWITAAPTYSETEPGPVTGDVFWRGYLYPAPSSALDLDRRPPGTGEPVDVVIRVFEDSMSVVAPPGQPPLAKAPVGEYVSSPELCAELLADADSGAKGVEVSSGETACLRTDEGRIACASGGRIPAVW